MPLFFMPEINQLSPDYSEVFRYLGYKKSEKPDDSVYSLAVECCNKLLKVISPKAAYDFFDLALADGEGSSISFADCKIESQSLVKYFDDCKKTALLAATIGPGADALIRKYGKLDTVKAGILQAAGAMFVEKLVDLVCEEIKKSAAVNGALCKPRFSPGYGDVSLEVQKDFFRLLPCSKIGLTLMDSLIMAPEKSVTAFVAIK